MALADSFDDQIAALKSQAASQQSQASDLHGVATNYQDRVNQLNTQMAVINTQIRLSQVTINQLNAQISDAEAKLSSQKSILAANIKQMYLDSGVTPLEMLASSQDISDYMNKQQYQDKVKDKVQDAMASIVTLKKQLDDQQHEAQATLVSQQGQQAQVGSLQAEANQLLATAQQNATAADQLVKSSNSQIANLKAAQAAALAAKYAGSGSNLKVQGNCGGGYPSTASGRYGSWGCSYGKDNAIDNWGMYNQECVSYTAYRIGSAGRGNPSGWGNANQWPSAARRAGYAVDSSPRVGDVAISMLGSYGHAMYVEGVSGGSIYVSQYNFNNAGEFSTMTISSSGLYFIHF